MNDSLNYGINVTVDTDAARPIQVVSSTPVAMSVLANTDKTGLIKFNGYEEGLKWCEDNAVTAGTLHTTLQAFFLVNVVAPLLVHVSTLTDDENENMLRVSKGVDTFGATLAPLGLEADLIIAPMYSHYVGVGAKLDSMGAKLWGTGITCSFANTEAESVEYLANFGSKFLHITNGVSIVDGVEICNSAFISANIAYWDNGGDNGDDAFGWAKNHSNRVIHGIEKSTRKDGSFVEYRASGDTEARRLRQQGMSHIVRDDGWRVYGFETTDIDLIWRKLARVRTFLRLGKTLQTALKWIRDREANQLVELNKSVDAFFRGLRGNGVVIGFEAFFDPLKNLDVDVTAGKFRLTIRAGDMPSVAEFNIDLLYSDDWNSLVIQDINKV